VSTRHSLSGNVSTTSLTFILRVLLRLQKNTQLHLFNREMERYSGRKRKKPKNWYDAFDDLRDYLSSLKKDRIVVFLDELPWMDTPKSSFLSAFSYFWNDWASTVPGLKLFVCGHRNQVVSAYNDDNNKWSKAEQIFWSRSKRGNTLRPVS